MKLFKKIFLAIALSSLTLLYLPSSAQALSICAPGEPLDILWKGRWYAGQALKAKGRECYIHYQGYSKSWDEWVGSDRIRHRGKTQNPDTIVKTGFRLGDPVQVLWKGRWYPAKVLKIQEDLLKIRYDGYDSSWDEWVGPERYRKK